MMENVSTSALKRDEISVISQIRHDFNGLYVFNDVK